MRIIDERITAAFSPDENAGEWLEKMEADGWILVNEVSIVDYGAEVTGHEYTLSRGPGR